ncbi:MAG: ABC transporter ATP-binding protein [Lachnospiraceae bacterium]|nr:ABC transporter ATP-binding protein [Lachnospiraceae bacterium]
MEKLGRYIKPFTWYIILTMGIKLFGTILELLIPYFMEIILDDVVPTGKLTPIILYGGLMLLCAAGCLTANVGANRMSAISSGKITRKLRYDLFEKLEHLSARQMDQLTVPSAESRLTSDTYNINQLLARMQRLGIRAPILLLGGVFMMLSMDPVLSLVLVFMLPFIGIIVYTVTKKSVPLYKETQSVLDRVVRVLQENITGVRVIKALSKTDYEKKRFNDVNDELTRIDQKAGMITAITNPSTSLILNLGLTLVVLVGAFRVNSGNTRSGVIIAFLQYFVMILNAMLGITKIFIVWSKGEASAHRVADVLAMPEDLVRMDIQSTDSVITNTEPIDIISSTEHKTDIIGLHNTPAPHIEFRDVTFSYTGIGANLDHLNFKLMRGESLGILGEIGSGKSTVLNLLLRFYDPQDGAVLIDGRDIRSFTHEELRSKFGVVFQNDFVMEGTIEDNISFFRPIDETDIAAASEDAQAAEFIKAGSDGMKAAVVVRGNNLSGGQKQRLLISRALASRPEILLLDDASSALDYRTDALLRKALHKNYSNTTTILVAQRISSIRGCTHILVLSDGKTVGSGTHEELMKSCEEYRIIAQSQMGDGKEFA